MTVRRYGTPALNAVTEDSTLNSESVTRTVVGTALTSLPSRAQAASARSPTEARAIPSESRTRAARSRHDIVAQIARAKVHSVHSLFQAARSGRRQAPTS